MASTQMSTLAQLLRQPASKSQPTGATVSDCLDACVPVYSFPDRPFVKAQRSKLPRVESLPAVPDFYEQYERCVWLSRGIIGRPASACRVSTACHCVPTSFLLAT